MIDITAPVSLSHLVEVQLRGFLTFSTTWLRSGCFISGTRTLQGARWIRKPVWTLRRSLGADHIENTASNSTSIVARGQLPSNGSSTVAYLQSYCLVINTVSFVLRSLPSNGSICQIIIISSPYCIIAVKVTPTISLLSLFVVYLFILFVLSLVIILNIGLWAVEFERK
jgi:hypothetical protein